MTALAALSTVENANLVWQKATTALNALEASGAARDALRATKAYLSQIKHNPDLRFSAVSNALVVTADDGQSIGSGTANIYFVYLKKPSTNGTDCFVSIVDNGTDDNYYGGSLTGSVVLQSAFHVALDEFVASYNKGLDIANGIRVVSTTAAAAGTTVSTLAATVPADARYRSVANAARWSVAVSSTLLSAGMADFWSLQL